MKAADTRESTRERADRFNERLESLGVKSHMFTYDRGGRISMSFDDFDKFLDAVEADAAERTELERRCL